MLTHTDTDTDILVPGIGIGMNTRYRSNPESDRGIFIVSILRTILMEMIYADKYDVIDKSMSDSNIGASKKKNIRNHIFVVNSILHDVLSSKTKEPIDIMVLDYKQMFDLECLYACLNDVYEADQ